MVGFKALSDEEVKSTFDSAPEGSKLKDNKLEDVLFVNEKLREYQVLWDQLEYMLHIDAEEVSYVYDWRLEAEKERRAQKGEANAMSDEQVKKFVDGYIPAYELYTEGLRSEKWRNEAGRKLRFVVGKDRKVKEVETI